MTHFIQVSYYINWFKTSCTYIVVQKPCISLNLWWICIIFNLKSVRIGKYKEIICTVCPRRSYQFYIVSYFINWVTTSWTHSNIVFKYSEFKDIVFQQLRNPYWFWGSRLRGRTVMSPGKTYSLVSSLPPLALPLSEAGGESDFRQQRIPTLSSLLPARRQWGPIWTELRGIVSSIRLYDILAAKPLTFAQYNKENLSIIKQYKARKLTKYFYLLIFKTYVHELRLMVATANFKNSRYRKYSEKRHIESTVVKNWKSAKIKIFESNETFDFLSFLIFFQC